MRRRKRRICYVMHVRLLSPLVTQPDQNCKCDGRNGILVDFRYICLHLSACTVIRIGIIKMHGIFIWYRVLADLALSSHLRRPGIDVHYNSTLYTRTLRSSLQLAKLKTPSTFLHVSLFTALTCDTLQRGQLKNATQECKHGFRLLTDDRK